MLSFSAPLLAGGPGGFTVSDLFHSRKLVPVATSYAAWSAFLESPPIGHVFILKVAAWAAPGGFLLAAIWETSFLRQWVVVTFFAILSVVANLWTLNRRARST